MLFDGFVIRDGVDASLRSNRPYSAIIQVKEINPLKDVVNRLTFHKFGVDALNLSGHDRLTHDVGVQILIARWTPTLGV
jgi:hypothetical protein